MITADSWDDNHQNWTYHVSGTDLDGDALTLVVVLDDNFNVVKVITGHG